MQVQIEGRTPLYFKQFTVDTTAGGKNLGGATGAPTRGTPASSTDGRIPAQAKFALVTVETAAVRWRDDGTAPTTAVGHKVAVDGSLEYDAKLDNFRVISASGTATVNVSFYG